MVYDWIRREFSCASPSRDTTMLGKGSYGSVYRRKNRAVKASNVGDLHDDLVCWGACARELHCGAYEHAHICRRLAVKSRDSTVYIHMELGKPFDTKSANPFRLLSHIGSALQFLHSQNIMHRDVKPQNIIVVGGVYKLIDFGLSRPPSKDLEMLTGYMISRWWRPPELLADDKVLYTGKCDMWSLGVVYYQTLHKQVPFQGTAEQMLSSISKFVPNGVLKHLLVPVEQRYTSSELMMWLKRKPRKHAPPPAVRELRHCKVPNISQDVSDVLWQYKFKTEKYMYVALVMAYFVCGYDGDAEHIASHVCLKYAMTQEQLLRKLIKLKRIW